MLRFIEVVHTGVLTPADPDEAQDILGWMAGKLGDTTAFPVLTMVNFADGTTRAAAGGGQEAATGEADTPNWLEAPPDSAADAAAGEFRRRVLSTSPFAEAAKWR